jgi:hypothetical protein
VHHNFLIIYILALKSSTDVTSKLLRGCTEIEVACLELSIVTDCSIVNEEANNVALIYEQVLLTMDQNP